MTSLLSQSLLAVFLRDEVVSGRLHGLSLASQRPFKICHDYFNCIKAVQASGICADCDSHA
jgi:hypothetical protein